MPTKIDTPLSDGIAIAYVLTKNIELSIADLAYLLRKYELNKILKKKKNLYDNWKKELKDPVTNGWKYPFKQYDVTKTAIEEMVKNMCKKGILERVIKTDKYRLSTNYIMDAIRIYDKQSLSIGDPKNILMKKGIFRFYGFEDIFLNLNDDYKNEFDDILDKLLKIIAQFYELQYRITIESFFKKIRKLSNNEKNLNIKISPLNEI